MTQNREFKANGSEGVEKSNMTHMQAGAEEACRDDVFNGAKGDKVQQLGAGGLDKMTPEAIEKLFSAHEQEIKNAVARLEKIYSACPAIHANILEKSGEDYAWLKNPQEHFEYVAKLKDKNSQTPEGIQATMKSFEQAAQPRAYDS